MKLPEQHRQRLIEAHKQCSEIIKSFQEVPEPLETALLVEEHRWFWKPKDVKFVLVGESHVYTNEQEIKIRINPNKLPSEMPRDAPQNFAKLVYCLGYGEPSILDKPENIENNPGTRQYIDLLKRCSGLNKKPTNLTQLEWKAKILNTFKEKGFWLLDASVHACSMGKRERLDKKIVERILPVSWKKYVRPIIDEIQIDRKCVWIIGKSAHDILSKDRFALDLNWIYQPNVRFKNSEKYHEKKIREQQLEKAIEQHCMPTPAENTSKATGSAGNRYAINSGRDQIA